MSPEEGRTGSARSAGRPRRGAGGAGGEAPARKERKVGAVPVADAMGDTLSLLSLPGLESMVRLSRAWAGLVGPAVASKALPDRLRGGVLYLRVEDHAWAQELSMRKPLLLSKLSALLGDGVVKDIRFEASPLPARVPAQRAPGGAAPPPPSTPVLPAPEGLDSLEDPETRRIILSIQRKAAALAATSGE